MIVVVVLSAAAVAGLFVNAKMGFGFSLVVVPLASLIVGFGPAVLFVIVLEVFLSLSMAWVLRRELRLLDASLLKLGSFIGILCAWLMSRYVSGQTATIAGMAAVIVSCIYILAAGGMKDKVPPRGWILPALGALSGLLNYWTSLSGPPVVLAYARSDVKPAKIVAILTGYFSLLYAYTFIAELVTGRYGHFRYWTIAIACSAGIVLAIGPVKKLVDKIDMDFHRSAVIAVGASAVVILVRALLNH